MRSILARWIGWARIGALILVGLLLALRINDPIPIQTIRNIAFDFFQQLHPREPGQFPVAVLDVDDPSIAEIGQWPWPRTRFAELVTKATEAGAVAIAFDIVFAEPDRLSPPEIARDNPGMPGEALKILASLPENDDALAEAFSRARVIVGQTSVRSAFQSLDGDRNIPEVPHAILGADPTPYLMKFPDMVQNLPQLEAAAAGRGVFSVRPDPDGVFRRVPIVMMVEGTLRLGLGPELLRVATGGAPFAVRTDEAGITGVVLAGQLVETAADGTVRPYLTPTRPDRFVSAADLLFDRLPEGRVAGHLLLVGTSAIGLEDYRATPLGMPMAGVEIHAQLIENILSGTLLSRPNYVIGIEVVAGVALSLLFIALTPLMSASFLILSTLFFLGAYGFGSYAVFLRERTLIDPTYPLFMGIMTVIFMATMNYLREERRRRQIRTAFGQYVSPDLVNELSDNDARLTLGGETRELTLLFSDVRGFTAIAESFRDDPAGLTALMNRFLTLLSKAILDRSGTIDKFMGDAVMAFWNAPLDHPDHARAACSAALTMHAEVQALNKTRRASAEAEGSDFHLIDVGIGINTGNCTVGNMGSDMRFDYTALGDPVNLASRLEGQSRYYGAGIIVGSSTHAKAADDFAFVELDLIRVKGKSQPERIFALLGDRTHRDTAGFQRVADVNARMIDAYREARFEDAEAALAELAPLVEEFEPELRDVVAIYRDRLAAVKASPPGPDWSPVYDATSK